jgi:hypothetical protein
MYLISTVESLYQVTEILHRHAALEQKRSKLRSAKTCRPKSDLGQHVSAFFKICFHVLEQSVITYLRIIEIGKYKACRFLRKHELQ